MTLISQAEWAVFRGFGTFTQENFRNDIYDYIVANTTCTIKQYYCETYEVVSGTGTEYGLRAYVIYEYKNKGKQQQLESKIDDIYGSSKTISLNIDIFDSHNDGIPGRCQPDTITRKIIK